MADAIVLYARLVGADLRAQMQYRFSFLADFLSTGLGIATEFAAILVLFLHIPALDGWTVAEVALLYGSAEIGLAVGHMVASGFDVFPEMVRLGDFDRVLVRPASPFLQVLGGRFSLRHVGRVAQGGVVFAAGVGAVGPAWGVGEWAFVVWTLFGAALFFTGLFIIGGTMSFWTVETLEVMNILTYGGAGMASYPFSIYARWLRDAFMYVVPLAFVNYVPFLYLLNKPDPVGLPAWAHLWAVPVCAAVLGVGVAFWHRGVRHYQSTGT